MKRVLVMAGALAMAACGSGSDEQASAATATPSPSPASPSAALAGTYGASGADGQPWTTQLGADGTYRNTVAGELTESGTWSQTGDQLCFTATPRPGTTPAETCQTLVSINDDGSLVVRDTAGQETTAPRIAAP